MNGQTQIKTQKKDFADIDRAEKPVIYSTKDYSMFKGIIGNRKVYIEHVNFLTKSVAKKNLLSQFPILVNKDMQVIDGQHRLEVAKNNNLTVYYIIADAGGLELIQELNSSVKPWRGEDYLNSYIALGIKDYKTIGYYKDTYKLNIMVLLNLLYGNKSGGRHWTQFKRGQIRIDDEKEFQDRIEAYMKIRIYAVKGAWKDREFIRAFTLVLENFSVEDMIERFEMSNWVLERQVTVKDYLREFERILNYKKQNIVRLF